MRLSSFAIQKGLLSPFNLTSLAGTKVYLAYYDEERNIPIGSFVMDGADLKFSIVCNNNPVALNLMTDDFVFLKIVCSGENYAVISDTYFNGSVRIKLIKTASVEVDDGMGG